MKLRTFFLASAVIAAPTLAIAADLYVSTGGNDSSSGTQLAPLKTISYAASIAKPGTVVHVAPGNYSGNITSRVSGRSDARIRFVSDTKWGAKIIGSGANAMWLNNGSYVDIVGFDISGPGRLGIQNEGSYTLIANNHVHDLKVSGGCTGSGGAGIVNSNYQASDGDIIGNLVHDIGTPGGCNGVQGIYHSHNRGRIINNIVYRASSFGIHLWHAANQTLIMNNTVFNNGSSNMGGGIVIGRGDSGTGVMINTSVINNIVYNNPATGITQYCYSGVACIGSNNVVANNLVLGSRTGISMRVGSATGTIAADPQFVNYELSLSGDFHLKSTSAAINKGSSQNTYATDFDGKPRLQGTNVDLGAYEFALSQAPAPAPTPAPTPAPAPAPVPPSAAVTLSATSLRFSSPGVGLTSPIQLVVVKNIGKVSIRIPKAFVMAGDFDFGGTGTCKVGVDYAPGQSCTASVVFKPKATGLRSGSLTMTTSASSTPLVVKLYGR